MANQTFETGKEISLSQLFSNDNKIIIPDMQRDYCWADKAHGENKEEEIVSKFIDDLINSCNKNGKKEKANCSNHKFDDLILGMLYCYEKPTKFIHLCDGQQRITTLFLLLGVLLRRTNCPSCKTLLRNMLISLEEQNDDWEPYLRYQIRENTLYFLQDLVKEYFVKNNSENKIENKIENQAWYNKEYDRDPTIQCMIKAVKIINDTIPEDINIGAFITFITENLKFFYYDMGGREHGEDMFVIINTTGESLTVSENVKPILLGDGIGDKINSTTKKNFNDEWEKREQFFWINRKANEHTADAGVKDFLTWFLKANKKQEDIHLIKNFQDDKEKETTLKAIEKYDQALLKLLGYLKNEEFQNIFKQINTGNNISDLKDLRNLNTLQQNNILIPLLAFIVKFKDGNSENNTYNFLRRLRKNHFDDLWKDTNRKNKYIDWRYVLQIIENSEIESVFEFTNAFDEIEKIIHPHKEKGLWFDEDEEFKKGLDEKLVIELENHKYLGGRLELFKELDKEDCDIHTNKFLDLNFEIDKIILWRMLLCYANYFKIDFDIVHNNKWQQFIFNKCHYKTFNLLMSKINIENNFNDLLRNKLDTENFQETWRKTIIEEAGILSSKTNKIKEMNDAFIIFHNGGRGGNSRWIFVFPERKTFYSQIKTALKNKLEDDSHIFIEHIRSMRYPKIGLKQVQNQDVKICVEKGCNDDNLITIGVLKTQDNKLNEKIYAQLNEGTKNKPDTKQYFDKTNDWTCYRQDSWEDNKDNPQKYADELEDIYNRIKDIKIE